MTRFFSGYFRVGRESVTIFQHLLICLAAGCFVYTNSVTIFDLASSSSFGEYYKAETFPLTGALEGGLRITPSGGGGGAYNAPHRSQLL